MKETKKLEQPSSQYFLFILISIIYFIGICIFFDISLKEIKALEPNSLGDFLAGVFAPLGFILLILGYAQNTKALRIQGDELKISNQALKKQCEELENSVEQQKLLVETTKEEVAFLTSNANEQSKKEVVQRQPFFHITKYSGERIKPEGVTGDVYDDSIYNSFRVRIEAYNSRAVARELKIIISHGNTSGTVKTIPILEKGESFSVLYHAPYSNGFSKEYLNEEGNYVSDISFSYLDEVDEPHTQTYRLRVFRDTGGSSFALYINPKSKTF